MTTCLNTNGNDPIERENDDIDQKGENFQREFLVLMFCVYLERMCILLFIGLSYQCQLGQMINSVVQLFCIITDFLSFFISVTERVVLSIISCLYISYFSSTSFCFT